MDGMTNLIKYMGCWIAIWPRGGPRDACILSFCAGPDWTRAYAQIGIGVGVNNDGTPYIVDESVRMGAALNLVIDEYNRKTGSKKPPVNLPADLEEKLEDWCRDGKFRWLSFVKRKKQIMCRIWTDKGFKRILADSFIPALALALEFDGESIAKMPKDCQLSEAGHLPGVAQEKAN